MVCKNIMRLKGRSCIQLVDGAFFAESSYWPRMRIWQRYAGGSSWITLLGKDSKVLTNIICDASGNNCILVSQLSTWSNITINGNQNYICTKTNNNTLECSSVKLWTDFNASNERTSYCTYSPNNGLNCNATISTPTVNNNTITIKLWNSSRSFTLNQSTDATITLSGGWLTMWAKPNWNNDRNKYCVYANDNTINCNESGWGGGWTSLRENKGLDAIQPKNNKKISVWNDSIVLHWSWYFITDCSTANYVYYPIINYSGNLLIRHNNNLQCVYDYVLINQFWLWLGWVPERGKKLVVNWNAVIQNHSFEENKVWINWRPDNDVHANLQVNGGIKIGSNLTTTPTSSTNCEPWSIDYYNGSFYGCMSNGKTKKIQYG